MATYLLRYIWRNNDTGENRDRVVWGFHVDAPAAPTADQAEIAFTNAFTTASSQTLLQLHYTFELTQVYDVVAGGAPVDEQLAGVNEITPTGNPGPQEVQICVSRWVNDSLDRPVKFGRFYWGPLAHGALNGNRPSAANQNIILNWQENLHLNYEANGWAPVVDGKGALHVPFPIVQYSTDDAFDTQRRRGIDPSADIIRVPGP